MKTKTDDVNRIPAAENVEDWARALFAAGLSFHPDDDPAEVVNEAGERVFNDVEVHDIRVAMANFMPGDYETFCRVMVEEAQMASSGASSPVSAVPTLGGGENASGAVSVQFPALLLVHDGAEVVAVDIVRDAGEEDWKRRNVYDSSADAFSLSVVSLADVLKLAQQGGQSA